MPSLETFLDGMVQDSVAEAERLVRQGRDHEGNLRWEAWENAEGYLQQATRAQVQLQALRSRVEVRREPLTYEESRHGVSFFADVVNATRGSAEAIRRLDRHRAEMAVELPAFERRQKRQRDQHPEATFEHRANPAPPSNFVPPLWVIAKFATAPRPERVVAALASSFPLPDGVGSVNLPRLTTGTTAAPQIPPATTAATTPATALVTSKVVTIAGFVDASMQLFEQSAPTAALDECLFMDLTEAYDAQLEAQLVNGAGTTAGQLAGILGAVPSTNKITYTAGSPTAVGMWPYFGKVFGQVSNTRKRRAECWLMRGGRWGWLAASEDTQKRPIVTPEAGPFPANPGSPSVPVGSLLGIPIFTDEEIPTTLGTTANQDAIVACRPSEMFLWESEPRLAEMPEVLSGTLQVRFRLHAYAAAMVARYPSALASLGGTGLAVQTDE